MNQDQKDLNSNNFNNQNNNGMPNNQPQLDNEINKEVNTINDCLGEQVGSSISSNTNLSNVDNLQHSEFTQPQSNSSELNSNLTMETNIIPNINTALQSNQLQNTNPNSQQYVDYANPQQTNITALNDEELLKAFVGNNYDKITTKAFNFSGFFFTTFYMFYRKMFLYGILLFLVNLVVLNIVNNFIVTIILGLIVGACVNKTYLYFAKKKVAQIKLQNPKKDINELKVICSAKGGTSVGKIFLGFFVEISISIIVAIIMAIMGLSSAFANLLSNIGSKLDDGETKNTQVENSTLETNSIYNGVIMYDTTVNIKNEFSMSVPSVFENYSDDYEYSYEYESGLGVFDECSVSLKVPQGYSSSENLINQMASYNADNNPTSVTNTTINNVNWYWFSRDDSFGKTYYYGTTKNNKVYLLEYEIQEDAANECDSYRQQVLQSINQK